MKYKKYRSKKYKKSSLVTEIAIAFILIFLIITNTNGNLIENESSDNIEFSACVDGDTAKFIIDGEVETVRFLAIDTPETKHPQKGKEPFGKEASDYTCNEMKNAEVIKLEYDSGSDKRDKYDRMLAWVFVDGKLLQEQILKNGLAKIAYIYGDYSYMDELNQAEKSAQLNSLGIWH